VLFVWGVLRIARPRKLRLAGTPGRPNRLHPLHVVGVLLAFLIASSAAGELCDLAVKGIADEAVREARKVRLQFLAGSAASVVWAAAGLIVAGATFRRGIVRGLGLSGRRWLYDSARGVLGYLAVLPVCVGLNLAMVFLFSVLEIQPEYHPVLKHLGELSLGWRLVAIVSVVVFAPLAEEVFFRGLLQSLLRRWLRSPWAAVLIASACFAAVHPNQPQAMPSLFALAVALGYNYERTGRLWAPILIHAIFNAVNLASWRAP